MPIPKQNDSALSSVIDIRTAGVNTEDAVVADTLLFRVLLFLGPRARFQNRNDPDNRRRSRKFHRSFFVVYVPSGRATYPGNGRQQAPPRDRQRSELPAISGCLSLAFISPGAADTSVFFEVFAGGTGVPGG